MSAGHYLAGLAFFLPTLAAALGAAAILARRHYPYLIGLPEPSPYASWARGW